MLFRAEAGCSSWSGSYLMNPISKLFNKQILLYGLYINTNAWSYEKICIESEAGLNVMRLIEFIETVFLGLLKPSEMWGGGQKTHTHTHTGHTHTQTDTHTHTHTELSGYCGSIRAKHSCNETGDWSSVLQLNAQRSERLGMIGSWRIHEAHLSHVWVHEQC